MVQSNRYFQKTVFLLYYEDFSMLYFKVPDQASSLSKRVHRMLFSFAVFSFVLASVLLASRIFLLPRFTQMQVAGEKRDIHELRAYHSTLVAQLSDAEAHRMDLLLPVQNEQYRALIATKQRSPDFLSVRQRLQNVAMQFSDGEKQVVFFTAMSLHENARTVEVQGEVRNVGQRSMTVLAQFVEAVHALPLVADVTNPRFTRSYTSAQEPFSPFTILITLR